ncbi:MAG: acyl-CoA dehydrogenase [Proteobacteria bacterium]|nr:acyl-CoA dehydrogenase [Pseudomonadota bacterium]MBU1582441.1 acyl-CoA dehydrogenase [Pseudomonadota bacterium]MBU2453761.1 acyl-CoA dehydrogenase [Pseudomonadota bacterium]MBU2627454.1 acyl-CoA dehydrogenase [Pseudomonadota bacterium]
MAQQLIDRRDLEFVLWEQMDTKKILENKRYREFNKKTCDLILKEARTLAIKEVLPTLKPGDEEGVVLENGVVKVPECFHRPFELLKEGEWPNLIIPQEMGGQGSPKAIGVAAAEYFMAANWALNCYSTMGNGTALMIQIFGTHEQKQLYVKRLTSSQWGGTMLLTESDAGSDVGALTTSAVKNPDGTYCLTGNKIFITNGDHDLADNIIHPVLARIEGDPAGTSGISIFLVPKYLVNPDGTLGERNDIVCTGIEEKHGIHASATCSMTLGSRGECLGYLLGEERKGMKIMFYMMNDARLGTGLQGLAYASASYLEALNYARERIQGRDLVDYTNREAKSVPIIKHPDVRRNLLRMKAYVSGMRSFFYYTVQCKEQLELDHENNAVDEAFFSLLTPIIKEYLAVMGYEVCNQAIQVFGGAGYTREYPVEQYARDCRIASIYEGTSGIQAMDFLARKIGAENGAAFAKLITEISHTTAQAKKIPALSPLAEKLDSAVSRLVDITVGIGKKALSLEFKTAFAHSLPFLHVAGDIIMAWMLLWRAIVSSDKLEKGCRQKDRSFYNGQLKTAQFFIQTELYAAMGKMDAIAQGCSAAIDIEDEGFGGL